MIDKKFSSRLVKAVLRRGQGLSDHNLIHPEREWFVGIGIALIALAGGVAWSIHLYSNYAHITPEATEVNPAENQVYRKNEIESALAELQAKKELNESVRQKLETRPVTPSFITIPPETTPEEVSSDESTPEVDESVTPETPPEPSTPIPEQAL